MEPKTTKRNLKKSDDDSVPGTPQEKLLQKRKQRKCNPKKSGSGDRVAGSFLNEHPESKKYKAAANGEPANNEPMPKAEPTLQESCDDLLDGIDFLDAMDGEIVETDSKLDLSSWKRCVVISIEMDRHDKVLNVREDNSIKEVNCRLQEAWINTNVCVDDIVSVMAVWNDKHNCYCINNELGYIVTSPDHLISGTSVVGSLFCRRKGVLAERFTGIDSNNKIMAIGSIVHELFQITLKRQLTTFDEITSICNEMLNSHQMMHTMYQTNMDPGEVKIEMGKFVKKIVEFIARYMTQTEKRFEKDTFTGKIEQIDDIEENIWIPKLGLKGKVDVSVKIHRPSGLMPIPLEIKTGKSSFSLEHRGQVVLYQMMMSELNDATIDSGLLLYLRDGVMKDLNINRNEQRGLIMLRNEFTSFIARNDLTESIKQKLKLTPNEKNVIGIPKLPEPINHHSACSGCPYNLICCSFLQREESINLSDNNPLKKISKEISLQLTSDHIEYFIKWNGLLALEEEKLTNENQIKNIWLCSPESRQALGQSIIDLVLFDNVVEVEDRYLHNFKRKSGNDLLTDLTVSGICTGEYLRVSTLKRIAIAAGRVEKINKTSITIYLERDLTKRYKDELFILDRNDSQTFTKFNLATIGALLDDRETTRQLRSIIIDRKRPTFMTGLPNIIIEKGRYVFKNLNFLQKRAVIRAMSVNEYLLLKGLPGTGKTETIVAIVSLLVMIGKSVLITSHTHSAVDNVLLRLLQKNLKFMRLADPSRVPLEIRDYCESVLTTDCKTPDDLRRVYNSYQIVGVTCLGSAHQLLANRIFDVCIVDEATQVFQITAIRPLMSATKFILVGDPEQLPPIVKSKEAKVLGADESLFHRLDSPVATFVLSLQYRMNRTIVKLANSLTYKGQLQCANDTVASATMVVKTGNEIVAEKWMSKCLSTHIDQSVNLLNTNNVFNQSEEFSKKLENKFGEADVQTTNGIDDGRKIKSRIYSNYYEAGIVLKLINSLTQSGVAGSAIGVIATYTSQANMLRKVIEKFETDVNDECKGVEVNTVDQYQGRDKSIIIYTCTKCDNPLMANDTIAKDTEILQDFRRLTVAITRSKHKLIIIGDVQSLLIYAPFKKLFSHLSGMSKIDLIDGKQEFSWKKVMEEFLRVVNK